MADTTPIPVLDVNYWRVVMALGKAFENDESEQYWAVIKELNAELPEFAWDNAISDHFTALRRI